MHKCFFLLLSFFLLYAYVLLPLPSLSSLVWEQMLSQSSSFSPPSWDVFADIETSRSRRLPGPYFHSAFSHSASGLGGERGGDNILHTESEVKQNE